MVETTDFLVEFVFPEYCSHFSKVEAPGSHVSSSLVRIWWVKTWSNLGQSNVQSQDSRINWIRICKKLRSSDAAVYFHVQRWSAERPEMRDGEKISLGSDSVLFFPVAKEESRPWVTWEFSVSL